RPRRPPSASTGGRRARRAPPSRRVPSSALPEERAEPLELGVDERGELLAVLVDRQRPALADRLGEARGVRRLLDGRLELRADLGRQPLGRVDATPAAELERVARL